MRSVSRTACATPPISPARPRGFPTMPAPSPSGVWTKALATPSMKRSGATGGPSHGLRQFGGTPAGPVWSTDTPLTTAPADVDVDGLMDWFERYFGSVTNGLAAGDTDGDGTTNLVEQALRLSPLDGDQSFKVSSGPQWHPKRACLAWIHRSDLRGPSIPDYLQASSWTTLTTFTAPAGASTQTWTDDPRKPRPGLLPDPPDPAVIGRGNDMGNVPRFCAVVKAASLAVLACQGCACTRARARQPTGPQVC